MAFTVADMERRVVRYGDLKPCLNAFIDTRSPGSEAKENFTIIGPGVSENPAQHVHIAEPHGFNIGGARQPPDCVNSQHSHETAEVFLAHTGRWRFDLGETGEDASVELEPGDLISLPTRMFRGFTNIGRETGFLFAVLGGDDPGRVTWAPRVFEMARDYGLMLMENGALIDTTKGEAPPPGVAPMPATHADAAAALRRATPSDAQRMVARADPARRPGRARLMGRDAPLGAGHGFAVSRLTLAAGEDTPLAATDTARVIFVQEGELKLAWAGGDLALSAGDTASAPAGLQATLSATHAGLAFVVERDSV